VSECALYTLQSALMIIIRDSDPKGRVKSYRHLGNLLFFIYSGPKYSLAVVKVEKSHVREELCDVLVYTEIVINLSKIFGRFSVLDVL
jgi:hypothetical protein